MTRANVRSLYMFHKDVLPKLYDESLMRDRVAKALDYVLNQEALAPVVEENISFLNKDLYTWLQTTAYFKGLSAADQEIASATLLKNVSLLADWAP